MVELRQHALELALDIGQQQELLFLPGLPLADQGDFLPDEKANPIQRVVDVLSFGTCIFLVRAVRDNRCVDQLPEKRVGLAR